MRRFLLKIFGKRVAGLFGGICFLSVSVLAAMYLTAGYSLEAYVSDQLNRIPWDVATLQRGAMTSYGDLQGKYQQLSVVKRSEALGFVRLQRGNGVVGIDVDGKPMPARWIALIATTDNTLLPPELVMDGRTDINGSHELDSEFLVTAALVTGSRASADPVRVNAGSRIRIYPFREVQSGGHSHGTEDDHDGGGEIVLSSDIPDTLFEATIAAPPSQMERLEFNKWMLNKVGSLSYLPEQSVVLAIPMRSFEHVVPLLDELFVTSEGVHGGAAAPPYLPELTHLIVLDHENLISSWELGSSIFNLSTQLSTILSLARDLTPFSYVGSDLHRVLSRMAEVSELVGLVTLLIAIPLLWLVWVVASMLGSLLLMNERRLIGLALIRGVPIEAIGSSLRLALVAGGLVGGILGLIVGLGLPVLGHSLAGQPVPPWSVFMRGMAYFPIFIGLGLAVALLAGQGMIKKIRTMTPREAMARVADNDVAGESERLSPFYIFGTFIALVLGGYKVCAWIAGRSLIVPLLQGMVSDTNLQVVILSESLLNFIAVPLFLFGIIGVLRWRVTWFQRVLNALTIPLVGKLHWFVAEHMALGRVRIASTLFLTALAMSLALLPQVAADSFYDRILRGVDISLGGDLQLEYSLTELADGKDEPAPVSVYDDLVRDELASIKAMLEAKPGVSAVVELQQFIIPGFYLPTQSGLMLNLLRDTEEYKNAVYYEEGLGLTQSFSEIIDSLSGSFLTASRGLLKARKVPLQSDIIFGYSGDYDPVSSQFKDVMAFLPGQPSTGVSQREGYATAEVDYLNYVMSSDARVYSTISRFTESSSLALLNVVPSRAVFLVNLNGEPNEASVLGLTDDLPIKPQTVRWQGEERENVSKDMFISLALGNMKVFMIGGLILAVAGVFVVGLANFLAERRTFSLLRLRGLPLPMLLRISLAMFLVPVIVGVVLGVVLGAVSGYGVSQAIWELPRIYGVAGFLSNQLTFSVTAWGIIFSFGAVLTFVALGFGVWPFRRTAREAIKES